jgi:hypothetical protein
MFMYAETYSSLTVMTRNMPNIIGQLPGCAPTSKLWSNSNKVG